MADGLQIVLGSTLLGTLVTSLANLVISYRLMKSGNALENRKAFITFRMRKLELLRELRKVAQVGGIVKPVVEATHRNDNAALIQYVIKANEETRLRISEYRKHQSCFRKSSRLFLDAAMNLNHLIIPSEEWRYIMRT